MGHRLLLIVTILVYFGGRPAHAQDFTIEAYGDSLTAGFLANTKVTAAPTLDEIDTILSDLVMFKLTNNRKYLDPHQKAELAWPQFLSQKLSTQNAKYVVKNLAVSGSRTYSLIDQVKKVAHGEPFSKAFFFIGHNDLCNNNESTDDLATHFTQYYEQALAYWDSTHDNSNAYLMPVGDVYRLYDTLQGYVWHKDRQGSYRCEDSWTKLFPYCVSHYNLFKSHRLENYLAPRIKAMNDALRAVVKRWDAKSGKNKYHFIENTFQFQTNFFAVDCYHLSDDGQSALSDLVYHSVTQ